MNSSSIGTLFFRSLVAVVTLLGGAFAAHANSDLYKRCAACHLPDGAGVPGLYPPLKNHLSRFLATQEGRTYLTQVVVHGVKGPMEIDKQRYRGVMASVVGGLSAQKVSDLLNDLVRRFGRAEQKNKPLFTSDDVKRAKAKRVKDILGLRAAALATEVN